MTTQAPTASARYLFVIGVSSPAKELSGALNRETTGRYPVTPCILPFAFRRRNISLQLDSTEEIHGSSEAYRDVSDAQRYGGLRTRLWRRTHSHGGTDFSGGRCDQGGVDEDRRGRGRDACVPSHRGDPFP